MKHCLTMILSALAVIGLVGCDTAFGGSDRTGAAKQTVATYWGDIGHGRVKQAYYMMTSGNQQTQPLTMYGQNMFDFLKGTSGVTAKIGDTTVDGDQATVTVTLISPRTTVHLHAYQHLYWENGGWKISDPNGGLSNTK